MLKWTLLRAVVILFSYCLCSLFLLFPWWSFSHSLSSWWCFFPSLSVLSWVLSFPSACRVCLYPAQASCCVPDTASCFQGWSCATGPSLPLCGFRPGAHEEAHLPLGSGTKTMWPRRLSSLPPGDSLTKIQGHSCMVQTPIGIRLPSCSLGFCNLVLLKVVRPAGVTSLGMFIEMHVLWPPLDLLNQKLQDGAQQSSF